MIKKAGTAWLLFAFVFILSCSKASDKWKVDLEYSWAIFGINSSLKEKASFSVDRIKIFKTTYANRDQGYSLLRVNKKELILESADKQFIDKFLLSSREHIEGASCKFESEREVYQVLFFKNLSKKIGWFRVFPCFHDGIEYGQVIPQNNPAVFYSPTIVKLIKANLSLNDRT
jgi:hypothetical protein